MTQEPIDFAPLNFSDPKVREVYRNAEKIAFDHIANRECIFCFGKANDNGLGMLSELERIGYVHSDCYDAFFELGFTNFKLIGYDETIRDYRWTIETR